MPRMKEARLGLEPYFKVRVVFRNAAVIHAASWTEPKVIGTGDVVENVDAEWIMDPDYGDTLGFIDWSAVAGIAWRWSE